MNPDDPDDLEDTALWNPNVPWDPGSPMDALTLVPPGLPGRGLFCAGHAHLADGRVLVMGGTSNWARIFDTNQENPWVVVDDMHKVRFYPTATTLPDGRVLVTSGTEGVTLQEIHEVFDPDAVPDAEQWTTLNNAEKRLPWYPFMFVLEDGRVFFAGPYDLNDQIDPGLLDVQNPDPEQWVWEPLSFDETPQVGWGSARGASAVMYAPGKILVAGGPDGQDGQFSTWLIDLTKPQSEWNWVEGPLLNHARDNADLVILPDGRLLMVGGECGDPEECDQLKPEWLDPNDPFAVWLPLAEMDQSRGYHSTALLLPDARVLVAGADDHPDAQMFSPPYLFTGTPRPEIECAPDQIHYGANFYIDVDEEADVAPGDIDAVNLVRLGAVTHAFDQNTRFVPLTDDPIIDTETNRLYVPAPANANIAPPGHYMLFLISDDVPSEAKFVQVEECPPFCPEFSGPEDEPDGVVDVFDLLAVISEWGECADPNDCPADVSGPDDDPDGVVDVFDLLAVMSNWGPCDSCDSECPPRTVQDCENRYSDDMERYESCLEWVSEQGEYDPE